MIIPAVNNHPGAATNRPRVYDRLSGAQIRDAVRKMHLIRRFEESAEDAYIRGQSYGTMHLSIGQEATAVGVCAPLQTPTTITSTHRGHGHCIAKGAELKRDVRRTARQGDRLLPWPRRLDAHRRPRLRHPRRQRHRRRRPADRGRRGARAKKRGTGAVAVAFFGDGANNEGAFHESLNLASVWKLPVVFVCENNHYGMSVSIARSTAIKDVAERAERLCHARRDRRRQRFRRVAEARSRRSSARARRRGTDADRIQDLSHARPLARRPQPLPHQGRDRGVEGARSDRAVRERARGARSAHRGRDRGDRGRGRGGDQRGGRVRRGEPDAVAVRTARATSTRPRQGSSRM